MYLINLSLVKFENPSYEMLRLYVNFITDCYILNKLFVISAKNILYFTLS